MQTLSIDDAAKKINTYLNRDTLQPYFVIADGMAECKKLTKILGKDFKQIYISDECTEDFTLDADLFIEKLNALDQNALCFGLGEYIYFTGYENILRMLQDRSFHSKVIFFCRSITNFMEQLATEDVKFAANYLCKIGGTVNFSIVKYNPSFNVDTDAQNFSELLKLVERGRENVSVKSELPLLNVKNINDAYAAIKYREPNLNVSPDALNNSQWQEYFFDENCEGYPPEHWRTFAAGFKNRIANAYLHFVFSHSASYEEYLKNLFFALLDVKAENIFEEFYSLRKSAVKNISSQYLDEYLKRLENVSDAVKYLTDNTADERRAMIKFIQGKEKIPDVFIKNYSAMNYYLTDYDFGDADITNYFRRYKKIKLCNVDDAEFKLCVEEIALDRPYNKFDTRQKILDSADKNAKLYWLDALGVEFLGYIKSRAESLNLAVKIEIARAVLPTLTSTNKNFYDECQGEKFEKNSKLDELKHSPEKFSADGKCSAPTYIDEELDIIDKVLLEIQTSLLSRDVEKIILTSDHGASRLAVMYGRENKFKMNSAGEHSGRCCLVNELDEKPNCATEENGYWVLANYDRFAGGRLASVEVHGGATLEEILVPVIEFSLRATDFENTNAENTALTAEKPSTLDNKPSAPLIEEDDSFDFFE